MLSEKMQSALNDQLNAEAYSAYLYLSMSAWFESQNLKGFARWMQVQAQEELTHSLKFYGHIHDRLGRVTLQAIEAPKTDWKSPLDAFKDALAHEQKVTGLINDLVVLARAEKDNAAEIFLQWFVTEQVEEEASADDVVHKLGMVGDRPGLLFQLDAVMGRRGAD